MPVGDFLSGFAASRDARLSRNLEREKVDLLRQSMKSKTKAAEGIGGTPVTSMGQELPPTAFLPPGGSSQQASTQTPATQNKHRSLGQKIGSGIKSILGFARGGVITKSGVAFVHKGESIIPAKKSQERKPLRMSERKSARR